MPPIIGIPLCLDGRRRWHPERTYEYIHDAYARAVVDAGGVPVYLPVAVDPADVAARIDGLLLPGGDDFLPPEGVYPDPGVFTPVPERRLMVDRSLLAWAMERRLPVLGICYGMQLLALHQGGTLLFHIPADRPEAGDHQLPEADGRHAVQVEAGTQLAAALGTAPGPVNSLHHQGVAEPGAGVRVCARADDGIVEAIEREGGPFCVGVQWHPEKMSGPHRTALFAAFVAACAETVRA